MIDLVKQLILEKREGDWWDFKREHHSNMIDLLHDILCMANVICDNDRFIIFGVTDNYELVGLDESNFRYTQADILNFLRTKSFANHKIPKISVETIFVDGKELDVLTIKNQNFKPYFLTRDETKKGSTVRAGVVYSRLGDSNTPKDSSANPFEIEAMWRARFGLDKKASERFVEVLLDFSNWKYDGISEAFYDIDPDYTIKISQKEGDGGKFWWEENLFEKPERFYYFLKYKSVVLYSILVVRFRNENLVLPFPNVEYIACPENNLGCKIDFYCDIFFYLNNTVENSLFKHIRALEVPNISNASFSTPIRTQKKPPIIELPFIFFETKEDLKFACENIRERFKDFIILKDNTETIAEINDSAIKRYATESLFSEWAFSLMR